MAAVSARPAFPASPGFPSEFLQNEGICTKRRTWAQNSVSSRERSRGWRGVMHGEDSAFDRSRALYAGCVHRPLRNAPGKRFGWRHHGRARRTTRLLRVPRVHVGMPPCPRSVCLSRARARSFDHEQARAVMPGSRNRRRSLRRQRGNPYFGG